MNAKPVTDQERVDGVARCILRLLDRIESDVNRRPRRSIHETRDSIQTAREWAESLVRLRCIMADADLLDLVRDLVDEGECLYDHHGHCQAHNLHERPCPHERAKALLGPQCLGEFA